MPNPGDLKLGMFVSVTLTGAAQRTLAVARSAVQMIGERAVVYVALGDGNFVERTVQLGGAVGDVISVTEGLRAEERVVSEGSFFLRAEAARLRGGA